MLYGSNINAVYLVTQFYSNLGYNGELECHHIDPEHTGAMCVAPQGFNSAFHSYVNNLIKTWISTLNKDKGNISATTNNVLINTDPYVKKLYRTLLRDFISGKICPPKLTNYRGKVFYKTSLEKRLGIKF